MGPFIHTRRSRIHFSKDREPSGGLSAPFPDSKIIYFVKPLKTMTPITQKLLALSEKSHKIAATLAKRPIAALMSLALVAGLAATIAGFSEPTPAPTGAPAIAATEPPPATATAAAPENTLPMARTLTSADGRKLDVTILSKSATAIQCRVGDKEVAIPLDKLSADDQAFVAGLANMPTASNKKHTVLLACKDTKEAPTDIQVNIAEVLEKIGYTVTICDDLNKYTDEEIKKFDVIWFGNKENERERFIDFIPEGKLVVYMNSSFPCDPITYNQLLTKKWSPLSEESPAYMKKPFVKYDKGIIFYSQIQIDFRNFKKNKSPCTKDPEILGKVIEEIKKRDSF